MFLSKISAPYSLSEVFGGEVIFEGFVAVDGDDWNLEFVAFVGGCVLFYVNLFKSVFALDSGGEHLALGLFAEMAAGLCVERDVWFCVHLLT